MRKLSIAAAIAASIFSLNSFAGPTTPHPHPQPQPSAAQLNPGQLPSNAGNPERFTEHKKNLLAQLDARLKLENDFRACATAATAQPALRACGETFRAKAQKMRSEHMAARGQGMRPNGQPGQLGPEGQPSSQPRPNLQRHGQPQPHPR